MIDGSPLKRRLKKFHDSMTTGVASSTSSAFVKDLPSAKADTGKGGTLAIVAFAHGFRHWIGCRDAKLKLGSTQPDSPLQF